MEGTTDNEGFPAQPGVAPTDEVVDEASADEVAPPEEPTPPADDETLHDEAPVEDADETEQEDKPKPNRRRTKKSDASK